MRAGPGYSRTKEVCLMHYADAAVYPHLSYWTVAVCGATVCSVNLGIYLWRFVVWMRQRQAPG